MFASRLTRYDTKIGGFAKVLRICLSLINNDTFYTVLICFNKFVYCEIMLKSDGSLMILNDNTEK